MVNLAMPRTHATPPVVVTIALLAVLGVSATAGGIGLISGAAPPRQWLDSIPLIDSWIVPGLVLGVGFGLGSLVTAYGLTARYRWAWLATVLIGAGQVVWIALELVYLPRFSWLQPVFGAVGLALVLLPMHPGVRRYLTNRGSTR
jgi:hypothetical protein